MAASVKIDDKTKNRIQYLAGIRNRSAHWVIREAIRDYIEREETRGNFRQEALESWTTYKETPHHLSGEEVRDWLKTWGNDTETEIPKRHE